MTRARRLGVSLNARLAALSVLALLATVAAEPLLFPAAEAVPRVPVKATLDEESLTLGFEAPVDARGIDPAAFELSLNGAPVARGLVVEGAGAGTRILRVEFPEGAASDDEARVAYVPAAGGPALPFGASGIAPEVATPAGALPGARIFARGAQAGDVAYVVGGTSKDSLRPTGAALDGILRVDLATGATRTMRARLPAPIEEAAVAWDSRATPECPEGCAYVFGGRGADGALRADVLRYDPAADEVKTLPARLPRAAADLVALWTGSVAVLLGGEQEALYRFDPATGAVETIGASPLTAARGIVGVFDPRPSAECPAGCGYLFGGYAYARAIPGRFTSTSSREAILRFDAATGTVTRLASAFPETLDAPAAAWDGERAIVAGGLRCNLTRCEMSRAAWSFDPRSGDVTRLGAELPDAVREGVAAWRDGELVLVAGSLGRPPFEFLGLDAVVRLRPDA